MLKNSRSNPLSFDKGESFFTTWVLCCRLADLSLEFEMETPSTEALLSCIVNREDVEKFMCQPVRECQFFARHETRDGFLCLLSVFTLFQGRRFCGPQGQNIAAAKIQATWRMYKDRDRYLKYRKKKIAAGIICISWVLSMKLSKVRKQLAASRLDQLETFRREAKVSSEMPLFREQRSSGPMTCWASFHGVPWGFLVRKKQGRLSALKVRSQSCSSLFGGSCHDDDDDRVTRKKTAAPKYRTSERVWFRFRFSPRTGTGSSIPVVLSFTYLLWDMKAVFEVQWRTLISGKTSRCPGCATFKVWPALLNSVMRIQFLWPLFWLRLITWRFVSCRSRCGCDLCVSSPRQWGDAAVLLQVTRTKISCWVRWRITPVRPKQQIQDHRTWSPQLFPCKLNLLQCFKLQSRQAEITLVKKTRTCTWGLRTLTFQSKSWVCFHRHVAKRTGNTAELWCWNFGKIVKCGRLRQASNLLCLLELVIHWRACFRVTTCVWRRFWNTAQERWKESRIWSAEGMRTSWLGCLTRMTCMWRMLLEFRFSVQNRKSRTCFQRSQVPSGSSAARRFKYRLENATSTACHRCAASRDVVFDFVFICSFSICNPRGFLGCFHQQSKFTQQVHFSVVRDFRAVDCGQPGGHALAVQTGQWMWWSRNSVCWRGRASSVLPLGFERICQVFLQNILVSCVRIFPFQSHFRALNKVWRNPRAIRTENYCVMLWTLFKSAVLCTMLTCSSGDSYSEDVCGSNFPIPSKFVWQMKLRMAGASQHLLFEGMETNGARNGPRRRLTSRFTLKWSIWSRKQFQLMRKCFQHGRNFLKRSSQKVNTENEKVWRR